MDTKFLDGAIMHNIVGRDINNAESVLSRFGKVKFCDEGYDDAIDDQDSEDNYVMYRSFDLTADNKKRCHVKLYYGDQSRRVGTYGIYY